MKSAMENGMLFAVDVGNSHTVSGVFTDEGLVAEWRLTSDRDRTGDELAIRYHALFQLAGLDPADITGFIVSSVVPALETVWLAYAARYLSGRLKTEPLVISHTTRTGIVLATEHPAEVGADRIVNAVAALQQYSPPLIVIDFGTAITFDCVSVKHEYLGGAILPGLGISLDALASRTAKLPRVDIDRPPKSLIGKTTVDAIRSGLLIGSGGMVDRMVERLSEELSPEPAEVSVVGTGGMAHLIAPYSNRLKVIDPYLTLNGLRIIYEMNCGNAN